MTERKTITVIVSGPTDGGRGALSSELSPLRSFLMRHDNADVALIHFGADPEIAEIGAAVDLNRLAEPTLDRLLRALGVAALSRRLQTSPIGRLLVSLGPLHEGRVTWRRVRKSREALQLLKRTDLAIAADIASVTTAWRALRRGWVNEAHLDTRAVSELRDHASRLAP